MCGVDFDDDRVYSSFGQSILIYDRQSKAIFHELEFHSGLVTAIQLDMRGNLWSCAEDQQLHRWKVMVGMDPEELVEDMRARSTVYRGHTSGVRCMQVSGDRLATGSYDQVCVVFYVNLNLNGNDKNSENAA